MTINDYSLYIEALASCAIEGNQFAIEMLDLRDKDPKAFLIRLEEWVKKGKKGTS